MKYILSIALLLTLLSLASCEEEKGEFYTVIPPQEEEVEQPIEEESPVENTGSDYYPYDRIINTPTDEYFEKVCTVDSASLLYRMLFPRNYVKGEKYPLIVVLHGTGERGDNNSSQLSNGGSFFLTDSIKDKYPAIVVFPQCPSSVRWDSKIVEGDDKAAWTWDYKSELGTAPTELLRFLIMDMVDKNIVDSTRLYVGGISMGAMGAYELAYRLPGYFAAGFFMSGGGNPADFVEQNTKMAFRIQHGDVDGVVLPQYATDMDTALTAAGIESKLDMYTGISHGGWNSPMFAEPDFMSWLWSHSF